VSKETFKKLRAEFIDIKKIMTEFLIKKEHFVFKKESDVKEDYQFLSELGKGTYGVVYLAKNIVSGAKRAIKEINRSKIKRYERFINEVTAMKTLDHPNIIKLFEIYESDECVYLV
jgi:calcium-dependent protein kinase